MNFFRFWMGSKMTEKEKFSCWGRPTCLGKFYLINFSLTFYDGNYFLREIDQAFLRRFERKILIDIPSFDDRQILIKHFLPSSQRWRDEDLQELALLSENFTGDDIRVAIKEANMMIIRKNIRNKCKETLSALNLEVEFHHLKDSLKQIKPNSESDINKHRQWVNNHVKY